ncbi:MAG: hypothetical protein ABH896_00340 [Candidatus Jacksonbacteria bacterium]
MPLTAISTIDDVKKFFNDCKKIAALGNGADDVDISMEEEIEE